MKKIYAPQDLTITLFSLFFLFSLNLFAQVGIGTTTPDPNAKLDITSTVAAPGGLLLPRVALQATNMVAPFISGPITAGMTVYNTAANGTAPFNVTPGFYYHDGAQWVRIATGATISNNWALTGNSSTTAGTNFLGTTDNVALQFKTRDFSRFEITTGTSQDLGGRLRAFTNGSAAEPIYSWNTNPGTGMYQTASNTLGFSTSGNERMRILPDGRIVVNRLAAPETGNRFSANGLNNEEVFRGYATGTGSAFYGNSTLNGYSFRGYNSGTGKGVLGYATGNGIGVHGQTGGNSDGVFGASVGTATGVTAITTGSGRALWVQNSGIGDGMYMTVADGDGMFNSIANGSGIYNLISAGGNAGVINDLQAAGGIGEFIAFNNRNGIGVDVSAVVNPSNPNAGTAGNVWGYTATVKTNTASTNTTAFGGILAAEQYGRGHGILMAHYGVSGRNAEFDSNNVNSTDPNVVVISKNKTTALLVQNQTSNIYSPISVADISYTGSDGVDHIAISGFSHPNANNYGVGVRGTGGWYGVHGIKNNNPYQGYGVFSTGDYGGTGAKFFVIDDPRDPENKYLRHMSIESNEVLNLYRGTATFLEGGMVSVQLPDYYDIININASYQLTPIGASMPNLYIEKEVENGTFVIAGGVPGKKVSWILTAERNDPYMKQNPQSRDVVVDKEQRRGQYLMPELYGQPKEKMIGFYEPQQAETQTMHTDATVKLREDDKSNTAKAEAAKAIVEKASIEAEAEKKKGENENDDKNSPTDKSEINDKKSSVTKD